MKKLFFYIGIIFILATCNKPVEYTIYIQSTDSSHPILLTSDGNFKQNEKLKKTNTALPYLIYAGGLTVNGNEKHVGFQVCRSENLGFIRGFIGDFGRIQINNQSPNFYQVLYDNINNNSTTMTNDSVLNYLKINKIEGYFEMPVSKTCFDGKVNI